MFKELANNLITPLQLIIRDSRSLGIILIICTIVSLLAANSGWSEAYISFWNTEFHFPSYIKLPHSITHWINDGLMAVFFFMVGMEIKRELLDGELKEFKKAILPVFAALGGMVIPALIYTLFNKSTPFAQGWGIPMATDIAFSLGIASILGPRVPVALKVFLTALAIIDDLGAIAMIAIFYGDAIQWAMLGGAIMLTALLAYLSGKKISFTYRLVLAIGLWYLVLNSGLHATVAGVIFAFTIPLKELSRLEHKLHVPVNFIILPIFALANTAILLPDYLGPALNHPINFGILAGLTIGKPLGIILFCYILIQLKWGALPVHISVMQLLGVGMLAGIGFTMSIFIATLAFPDHESQDIAKISVLLASLLSVILGSLTLLFFSKKLTPEP